ncbi:MAG: hypothetical protein R3313_01880 [Candidatus Saccharimonadales bacterium]|nr:hypothetical protein [Candidatus Saccharimonadales bacterium]
MRYRYLLLLLGLAVLVQYLVLSEQPGAILLPELALLVLVIMRSQYGLIEFMSAALFTGYLADILGAVEAGSLIAGYIMAGLTLVGLQKIKGLPPVLEMIVSLSGGLAVFHFTIGLVAAPVIIPALLSMVVIQFIGGMVMVQINSLMQRLGRPA